MAYRRYKRRYKKSTNMITMKIQSFMDISTKPDEMQIISVSAGGSNILNRLPAQFGAYKYYKIGNIACKLVPASTLPVDPSGLSLEVGEPGVDPRDQLTPGMMRITNGEDVFEDITGMIAENQHKLYNAMMLDPRWFKWMLQRGVKRHATPRFWQIGQLHQDKWPGAVVNVPNWLPDAGGTDQHSVIQGTAEVGFHSHNPASSQSHANNGPAIFYNAGSSDLGLFQVGHRGVLGWLPTDGMQNEQPFLCSPPEIEVLKIILPPAYKTKYYYRMFITETIYFREPIVQAIGISDFPYRPLDIFHVQRASIPRLPDASIVNNAPSDQETGGNYGDD